MSHVCMHTFHPTKGCVGADFPGEFAKWVAEHGCTSGMQEDLHWTINDEFESAALELEEPPGDADEAIVVEPPPKPVSVATIPEPCGPSPWDTVPSLQVEDSGTVMDFGGSKPVPIGKLYILPNGGVRVVCTLPGHADDPAHPCYMWLPPDEARGRLPLAHKCVKHWLHEGQQKLMPWGQHRTLADAQRQLFRHHVPSSVYGYGYHYECTIYIAP